MKLSVNGEIRIAPGSTPIWPTGESSSASIKHLPAIKPGGQVQGCTNYMIATKTTCV